MATPRTNASHDQNRVTTLIGVSTADGTTPVPVEVDPITGQLQVSSTGGGGGTGDGAIIDGVNSTIKATVTGALALKVDGSAVTQPVSQATGSNLHTVVDSGAVTATLATETTKVIGTVRTQDSLGNSLNSAGSGFLKVTDEPRQVFYDPFDAAIDTTNMWTSTTGSSGVAASVATGVLSMGTGTVANGYSKLTSIPTFKPTIPGWNVYSDAILIPDAAAPTANALRLWGVGTTPATPTFAAPATDGFFFELSGSTLSAVVYAGGTRTQIATGLTLATTYQRYIIQVRTDRTYFYIGTIDSAGLVATTSFQSPQIQTLPKLFLAVGNSTPPASNSQIQCTGAVVSDTGKNATQIADATYPWRRASVSSAGAVKVDPTVTLPAAPITGQKAVTTTVSALASNTLTQGVIIEALSTNTVSVFVGGVGVTASTGIELLPGASTSVVVANTSAIGVITASGTATVSFIGS